MTLRWFLAASACLSLLTISAHAAPAPSSAPAGSTGVCKDGSFSTAAERKGACRGHKGVKDWYASAATSTAAPAGAAPSAKSVAAAATSTSAGTNARSVAPVAANAAPVGGPGLVWVNTSTKVYHCQADKWYGKTKAGEYLSEADAKTKGFHAEHGKACSS